MTKAIPSVYEAIKNVTADLGTHGIEKGRHNRQQNYAFRGIEDVYKALNPLLAKHGLVILPRVQERETETQSTKNGGTLFYTRMRVAFDLVGLDGSTHTVETYGEAMDSGDKSHNKAQSVAYKNMAFMTFCIPTEGMQEDTEEHNPVVTGNTASPTNNMDALIVSAREWCEVLGISNEQAKALSGVKATNTLNGMQQVVTYLQGLASRRDTYADLNEAEKTALKINQQGQAA